MLSLEKVALSLAFIVSAMGSQAVVKDVSGFLQHVLVHPAAKALILFCMVFVSTRDPLAALFVVTLYVTVLRGMLDERHPMSVVAPRRS